MPALFPKYEFHAIDVNPEYVRGWAVIGGTSEYTIAENHHGEYHCTCPDWKFRGRKNRPMRCVHIDELQALLATELQHSCSPGTPEVQ